MLNVNRIFPSHFDRGPNALVWIAIVSLFTSVFIKLWTPASIGRVPEAIFTLLFFYPLFKNWSTLKNNRMIQAWGLALLAPAIFYGINSLIKLENTAKYAEFELLGRLYLFIPVAWWLGGHAKTIGLFLLTAFLGLVYACISDANISASIASLFSGKRIHLFFLNAQHIALFFSFALIFFISASVFTFTHKPKKQYAVFFALLFGATLSLVAIAGTQTRAAILGLSACLILFAVLAMAHAIRHSKIFKRNILIMGVASLLVTLLAIQLGKPVVARFQSESQTLSALTSGDWDNIPYSSIGIRINTWVQAAEWISEKPLIGYGGKVRRYIIQSSDKHPDWVKESFGHFHNAYIEIMLGYGVMGLLIALFPLLWALNASRTSKDYIGIATFYSAVLFLFMNLFESYLFFWMGAFSLYFIVAPQLSKVFAGEMNENHP